MSKVPCRHVGRETTAVTHFETEEGEPVPETWKFSRWERRVWVKFAEWARTMLPDPQAETIRNIDQVCLKDAQILRELQRRDHEEYQRVQRANQAEHNRVAQLNAVETAKAQQENRQPQLEEPKLEPWLQQASGYIQQAEFLTKRALDKACSYLSFNSPEMDSLLKSVPGSAYVFYLLLLPSHWDMTEDLACEIMQHVGSDEVQRILATAQGRAEARPKNAPAPAA